MYSISIIAVYVTYDAFNSILFFFGPEQLTSYYTAHQFHLLVDNVTSEPSDIAVTL